MANCHVAFYARRARVAAFRALELPEYRALVWPRAADLTAEAVAWGYHEVVQLRIEMVTLG